MPSHPPTPPAEHGPAAGAPGRPIRRVNPRRPAATRAGSSRLPVAASGTMAGMPKKPGTSIDELARMLWQAGANTSEGLIQQMLGRPPQPTPRPRQRAHSHKHPKLAEEGAHHQRPAEGELPA